MARLSREMRGLILPHDDYGSHLDEKGNTMGTELEEKNFLWMKFVQVNS
jgi:hypothetical protein